MESRNIAYIPQLDHLRAFAGIWIVLYHGTQLIWHELAFHLPFSEEYWAEHWIVVENPFKAVIIEGHTAVAFFMVLSGFIFTIGTYKSRVIYSKFIINRLLRTYPLFLLLLFTGIYAFPNQFDFTAFLQTLGGLANASHAVGVGAFSAMFWAIAVEWQFYLLFPFFLVMVNKKGAFFLLGLLGVFILMRVLACVEGEANVRDVSYFTILGRMDQFLIGMGLAVMKTNKSVTVWFEKIPFTFFLGACGACLFMIYQLNHSGGWPATAWWKICWPTVEGMVLGVFLLSYLSAAVYLPEFISKILSFVGKISYSIYLLHFIFISIAVKYQLFFSFSTTRLVWNAFLNTLLIIVPITLACSFLTFTFVEKPFLDMRVLYKR